MIFIAALVTFNEIQDLQQGADITIKGYLSRGEEGVFLAPVPQVKSCCQHKTVHLKINGEIGNKSPYEVVKITGIYEKGGLTPRLVE